MHLHRRARERHQLPQQPLVGRLQLEGVQPQPAFGDGRGLPHAPAVADEDTRLSLLKFFTEQKTVVAQSQRYAQNPELTTVIEGGAEVKPVVPQMHVQSESSGRSSMVHRL